MHNLFHVNAYSNLLIRTAFKYEYPLNDYISNSIEPIFENNIFTALND